MASVYSEDTQSSEQSEAIQRTRFLRFAQSMGACAVAMVCLWFLFGIPAYLLFGIFFD